MPEGLEIRLTARCLSPLFTHKKLLELLEHSVQTIIQKDRFASSTCLSITSKGKVLFIECETFTIVIHFGLTGYLSTKEGEPHLRYTFRFENQKLFYYDARNFGHIGIMTNVSVLEYKTKKLGIDVFDINEFISSNFEKIVNRSKHQNICVFLMDQKKIAGIGNYAKCEILYHANLSPLRTMNTLKPTEIYKLYHSICYVVFSCYSAGFSIPRTKNFYTIFDNLKCTQASILKDESPEFLHIVKGLKKYIIQVYDKKVDLIGNKVEKVDTPDKRTTYWVPFLQK
jgi:formamidopyrimidine-DNA glycosylase